ncbi:MAG: hypothetical protein AB8C95_06045 [Phycisphaeraceae bacterium]
MNNPFEMTAAYFEGKLNATQVAELEAYLREDSERAKAFVRQAILDSHLAELLRERNVQDVTADLSGDSHFGVLLDPPAVSKAAARNDELPPIHIASSDALTKQQYLSALSHVAKHTFTPKRIALFATAAALMLGVVLAIVLMTGPDAGDPIAEQPGTGFEQPAPLPEIETRPTVATLTAERDAVWAQKPGGDHRPGALRLGDQFKAGDRLTLTAGFAEITTNRGAVAILQAPATIELLDNNAIRLHVGKLVGLCEIDSSKGFVVKTDLADITDIGTEFGVDVSGAGLTRLHVFRGEVSVAVKDQQGQVGEAVSLLIGQAVNISADAGLFAVALDADRFAAQRGYKLAGQIKESFEQSLSLTPGDTESRDFMLLVPERKSVRLEQSLQVYMPTDTPSPNHQHAQKTLDTDTRVDSYLIHFDSAESSDGSEILTLRGEVRFDRPILGLILDSNQLHDTSALLGGAGVQYASPAAQVGTENWGDQVTISPDGKTLRLALSAKLASELGIDQVRVLVHAE